MKNSKSVQPLEDFVGSEWSEYDSLCKGLMWSSLKFIVLIVYKSL